MHVVTASRPRRNTEGSSFWLYCGFRKREEGLSVELVRCWCFEISPKLSTERLSILGVEEVPRIDQ